MTRSINDRLRVPIEGAVPISNVAPGSKKKSGAHKMHCPIQLTLAVSPIGFPPSGIELSFQSLRSGGLPISSSRPASLMTRWNALSAASDDGMPKFTAD